MIGQGTWGTCLWELDDNGNLTIFGGTGVGIKSPEGAPWHRYRQYIYTVQISERVDLEENSSLSYMFSSCENLQYADFVGLSTENVSAMNCMFQDCYNLVALDLSHFDTSKVISMSWMFRNCKKLESLSLSGFNTSRVTGMSGVFSSCSSLSSIDLSSFDTSNVVSMISMFMNCSSLTSLDLSGFNTGKVTDMSWMFCNCINLRDLNISNFYTGRVSDMSQMFSSCKSLKSVNLSGFVTYYTRNMENMFLFCDSLRCLDLSGFDTRNTEDMTDMFSGCTHLCSIVMGQHFNKKGNGSTNCCFPAQSSEMAADGKPWKSLNSGGYFNSDDIPDITEDVYYIEGNDFKLSYVAVTEYGNMNQYGDYYTQGSSPEIIEPEVAPPSGFSFKEWNTRRNGSGKSYQPGQQIEPLYCDVNLYAVWVSAPSLDDVEQPEAVVFGNRPAIKIPRVYDNNGELTAFGAEISPDGRNNWELYDLDSIPTVDIDGYYLRFFATNYMGTTYTNCINLIIDKARYDMSRVQWNYHAPITYSGELQSVELIGIPEGIDVEYSGNEAVIAGQYTATARIKYDVVNYEMPQPVEPCSWIITKARYDMSKIMWDYEEPFIYDGSIKEIKLTGLYGGLAAEYENNCGQYAGAYEARAYITYDEVNYENPGEIQPCVWGIRKADFDMKDAHWNYVEPYSYDGNAKTVYYADLPEGIRASYEGNSAVDSGRYESIAYFELEDENNYKIPDRSVITWEIQKADYDMSGVFWNYKVPFVYDGFEKSVYLEGLPEGVTATYFENSGSLVGDYEAHVSLSVDDENNYNTPEINVLQWSIGKANYDLADTRWNYQGDFTYDGTTKEVTLVSIPEGLTPLYTGNKEACAGKYTAAVTFDYDKHNYYEPVMNDCSWEIQRAIYDMDTLLWTNDEPLLYDGLEKMVYLKNLPAGVNAEYVGNKATNAGVYNVYAHIHMDDQRNYRDADTPEFIWEIKKACYNMDNVRWSYEEPFPYDGIEKEVKLINLPEGIEAEYSDNRAVCAAEYIAMASFRYDEVNYEKPHFPECSWQIEKAEYKLDLVQWNYDEAFTYDGNVKGIELIGLPKGVIATYSGNEAKDAGMYQATASFEVEDDENFYPPKPEECIWLIHKADMKIDNVTWICDDELLYDGSEKTVYLAGLPEELKVTYDGNVGIRAGVYEATAYFELAYNQNYETPNPIRYNWTIERANINLDQISWTCDDELVYDGKEKTIYLRNLPDTVIVEYQGNTGVSVGDYSAKAMLKAKDGDNYISPEPIEYNWTISKGHIELCDVHWEYDKDIIYDGKEHTVKLVGLPDGVFAELKGEYGIEAGKYTVSAVLHAEDQLNYMDPEIESLQWEIQKGFYDMSQVKWDYDNTIEYDGDEKHVELTGLPEGVEARYSGNSAVAAGKYSAYADFIIADEENYNMPVQEVLSWEIKKGTYDMSNVRWFCKEDFIYDGNEKEVHLVGLPEGVKAVYSGNTQINAGEHTASAAVIGDFDNYNIPEIDDYTWSIKKAWLDVSNIRWQYDGGFTYDESLKEILLVGLPEGVTAKYYNNKAVGVGKYQARAELVLHPKSNYKAPEIQSCEWEILKADYNMSKVAWNYEDNLIYDGNLKKIVLTGLPGGLIPHYSENEAVNAGEYEAQVSFVFDENNYIEPVVQSCKWKINKAEYDMTGVKWTYSEPFVYDGSEKEIKLGREKKSVGGFMKLFKSNDSSMLTGLPEGVNARLEGNRGIDAGNYTAKAIVTVDDPQNYEIPEIDHCHWVINKADYDMSGICWTDDGTYVYDGTEKSAKLSNIPEGITAIYSDDKAIEAGSHISHAEFSIRDENNYNIPDGIAFRWTISKARYDMSAVKWDYDGAFTYDDMEKSVSLVNLPVGVSPVYSGNSSIDAGVFVASAEFEYDSNNYEKPVVGSCKWKISKAVYDMSSVKWDYQTPFYYDGTEKAVVIQNLPEGVTVTYEHNRAIAVGIYTAKVTYYYDDKNYLKPEAVRSCRWEIKEADAL